MFTLLDLQNAYLQLEVLPEYQKYFGISIPSDHFLQERLPFELHKSAQIFKGLWTNF